jgi:hypothetical protein
MHRPSLWLLGLLVAGCGNRHVVGSTGSPGYLASDGCTKRKDAQTCVADTTAGCAWIDIGGIDCPEGVTCPAGYCYAPDPCLAIGDAMTCAAKGCAWSDAATLCPIGATCVMGGYCHTKDPGGSTCSCVTPVACSVGQECPPPECDCSGGGAGGGTCTCAAPPCGAGQSCPPVACNCDDGGGGGCVDEGTCTCACPACAPGTACPPCECSCGSGGTVPAPAAGGGGTQPAPDLCSAHKDEVTCSHDQSNKCGWIDFGLACLYGDPTCVSGVCQRNQMRPPSGTCDCVCPTCAPNTECAPCQCLCTDMTGGCQPPVLPPPPPGGGCPAIECHPQCPNGIKKDPNGCQTCACL